MTNLATIEKVSIKKQTVAALLAVVAAVALPQLFHVLRHPVPAAFGTEVQPGRTLRHGQAVSQMVVAHHGKATLRQIPGEVLVPQHVFLSLIHI